MKSGSFLKICGALLAESLSRNPLGLRRLSFAGTKEEGKPGKSGKARRPIHISDLGATAAVLMGLKMQSKVISVDLSPDLSTPLTARGSWNTHYDK